MDLTTSSACAVRGFRLEGVMNSADKPHWDADSSVSSVLRRSPVFRISKSFLSKFITPSSLMRRLRRLTQAQPVLGADLAQNRPCWDEVAYAHPLSFLFGPYKALTRKLLCLTPAKTTSPLWVGCAR